MNISFKQLRLWRALADTGSVGAAAAATHVTQPTASMQLKEITQAVGVPLYEVISRRVHLTQAGEALAQTARAISAEWESFEQHMSALKGHQTGRLRLSMVSTAKYFVPRQVGSFCALYPDVEVSLEVLNRDGVVARLRDNMDDLYIMSMPPSDMALQDQVFRPNPLVVIAAKSHPASRAASLNLSTLKSDKFILREKGSGTRMAALSILGQGATWLPCNTSAACDAILLQQVALLGGADACSRPAAGSLGAGAGAADDASGLVPVGVLAMTLAPTPLVVADAAAFSRLLNSVLSQTTVSVTLAGTASPRVGLNIGTLALTGVAIAQTVELSGMGGFLNPPVVVTQGELYNTSRTGVDLFVNFNLTNPAAITGRLGPITLAIDYAGASFITATIAPLVVNRGVNERVAAGR